MIRVRCAVVDDSLYDLEQVRSYFDHVSHDDSVCFEPYYFSNPLELDVSKPYDLYILDIDMPQKSGFDLTAEIYKRDPDARIIFLTNHEHLVFETFKLNAFYFVRKYFMDEELTAALKKYTDQLQTHETYYECNQKGDIVSIPYRRIRYFEVMKNDLYIHTDLGVLRERKSMAALIDEIEEDAFIQVNQNYLVNLYFISEIKDQNIVLTNGEKIAIPRRKEHELLMKYTNYVMRQL
ncbi:MAG: response regulator transcription factor [Lachnospiraceae bacterium]|nr:response regulator transcription factor [Solobacterium sp.]MBR6155355.1 response regulator transcription factor [Lachnospiraceae bacterium]